MLSGQDLLNYIGENLSVVVNIIDNLGEICTSSITLENKGDEFISKGEWGIFLSHICSIASESPDFDICHMNGGLFRMTPTDDFNGLKPGEKIEVALSSEEPVISRYSLFPKWYVAQKDLTPVMIKSTDDETLSFVKDFDSPKKWKKGKKDKSNPFTPKERFERYLVKDHGHPLKPVIPTLLHANLTEKEPVDLSQGSWVIMTENEKFREEIEILADYLEIAKYSYDQPRPATHYIKIERGEVKNDYNSEEAYEIKLDGKRPSVEITASSATGAFYAVQTLISLLETSLDQKKILPSGYIKDAPRFPYRGLHMDVSRNFASAEEVIKIIRVMSKYKMNKFHFHLTDDEGWRLEIKDLPELTEVGAKRDHILAIKELAVEPTLGSGPDSNSSGSGFYTVDDYRRILQVAKQHHVEVIPEIDMPGHSYAAVVAMTARYNKYKELGDMSAAEEYLLTEPDDHPSYTSDQMFTGNTMNPCLEGTNRFVEKIITTLIELHAPIQPLKTFHVGGDEVPVGAWDSSLLCQEHYAQNQKNQTGLEEVLEERDMTCKLQEHFMSYVEDLCKKLELQLAVWNDGIHDPTVKQESDCPMMVNAWRISHKSDRHNPYVLANSGYNVILSPATHTYFDHPYEPDPEENGLHWCVRSVDAPTIFEMKPYNMYACQEKKSKFEHEKLDKKSAVIGIQCQIWRELIRNDEMLEYMLFPRLLALAERAWHEADWESSEEVSDSQTQDWAEFANTAGYKELRRLEKWGIHYRLPPPGVRMTDDKLEMNSLYPGLRFKFREVGSKEWKECSDGAVTKYEKGKTYEFVTSSFDEKRISRVVSFVV